jgi:valyl-tRNA synthetase
VKGWEIDESIEQPDSSNVSIRWFEAKLNQTIKEIDGLYAGYRISEALMALYKLIWDDFCSWYLEMIKPAYQKPIDKITLEKTVEFFEKLMKLAHPFMPFITEDIWHHLAERKNGESIMIAEMPTAKKYDKKLLATMEVEEQVIIAIRSLRKEKNIPNKEPLELYIRKNNEEEADHTFDSVITKLCNLTSIGYVEEKVPGAASFIVKSTEFFVPLGDSIDKEAEIKKLEEELKYTKGFLISVSKKLSNERFVNSAPEKVVEMERKKLADAEGRIKVIEEQIRGLKS